MGIFARLLFWLVVLGLAVLAIGLERLLFLEQVPKEETGIGLAALAGVLVVLKLVRSARKRKRERIARSQEVIKRVPPMKVESPGSEKGAPERGEVHKPVRKAKRPRQRGSTLGIDCGAGSAKLVQVSRRGGRPVVINFIEVSLPKGAVKEGALERPAEVRTRIAEAMREAGMRPGRGVVALSSEAAIIRYSKLPHMKGKELRQAVKWEADRNVPIPPKEAVSGHMISEEEDGLGVVIAGAQKKVLMEYVRLMRELRLKPVAIDIDALAHRRWLRESGLFAGDVDEALAVVDIGLAATTVSVYGREVPRLCRTINLGSNGLTAAVASYRGVSWEAAERLKKGHGLEGDEETRAALLPVVGELVTEVRRCLEFFLAQSGGLFLGKVYLVGGGAMLEGLPGLMADNLNAMLAERLPEGFKLEVLVPRPGVMLHDSLSERMGDFGSAFGAALGAALREGR